MLWELLMSLKFSHLNAVLNWSLWEKRTQGDAHHTRLAKPSERFHKHFQPSDDCTVIKKACPTSCPCHASSVQQSSRLFGQLKQQTDLDKKKSYKNTNNFQMGCSPIDLIAWPCNYRHWPMRHRGEGMG